jgi:K+-transporting ATPase c subunit
MSKDGLKKLYLIKSAGFEYCEMDLRSNTLLLGESGVGKTTIMRAVLFFYTMNYSDSLLDLSADTKKSFNEWYFKAHNSHIVYEYTKGESRFLFIVSKSGKLHYTFVDITNSTLGVKELFVEDNMPLNLEKFNEKIQKEKLPNYSTTIRDKYIYTLHKRDRYNKKIKQESVVDFSLFENIAKTEEFAKTLSNIFISSKINSNSIKKSIVSLIENSNATVDLNEIKINLSEYVSHKDEIESFEKKIPNIEKLSEKFDEYNGKRKEFKVRANELYSLQQNISMVTQETAIKKDTLQKREKELDINYSIELGTVESKIKNSEKEIIKQETEVEKLKAKEIEYKKQNIDNLVEEFNEENNYKNRLDTNNGRYEALTSESKDLTAKYSKLLEKHKTDTEKEIFSLKEKKVEEDKKVNDAKNGLIEAKEGRIKRETLQYLQAKQSREDLLKQEESTFNTINVELGKLEFFPFNQEKIAQYEDEIKKFDVALTETKILKSKNDIDIKEIEVEIKSISTNLEESNEKLKSQIESKRDTLFKEKKKVEQRLDFTKDNLYSYLNKNNIANTQKIVTYLKDDILFSKKSFSVEESLPSESIFGLNLTFDEEFQNNYDQVELLAELKVIKESIKQVNREDQKKKKLLEDEALQNTKVKEKQRAILYQRKQTLLDNEKSYVQGENLAKLNLSDAKDEAKRLRTQETHELQKQQIECKNNKEELDSKIKGIEIEIESITSSINESVQNTIVEYDEQLSLLKSSLVSSIVDINNEFKQTQEQINEELRVALEERGVDEVLLLSISTEIESLKSKLESIELSRSNVVIYLNEYRDKIKTIPTLVEKLKIDDKSLKELGENKKRVVDEYKSKKEVFKIEKDNLIDIQRNIDAFSRSYKENIESRDIEKRMLESLKIENKPLNEESKIQPTVIDNLVKVYNDIKSAQESIESSVLKIIQNLKHNNIFKIVIPNDFVSNTEYLKTAKELIEYIKDDRLSVFKDVSLDKFKSSITLIQKQLSFFEEALLDISDEVRKLDRGINKATSSFKVIDSIDVRYVNASSEVLNALQSLSSFYDENNDKFLSGLFDSLGCDKSTQKSRAELREKIVELVALLNVSKEYLTLENGFVVEFKAVERGNDLKWRQTLDDIGSTGTSTLVKSIINISMLKLVSSNIVKDSEIVTHCILDEVGTISTEYFKELKDFVNKSGFVFLNGMPTEDDMIIDMYPSIYIGQNFGKYSKMIFASKQEA